MITQGENSTICEELVITQGEYSTLFVTLFVRTLCDYPG